MAATTTTATGTWTAGWAVADEADDVPTTVSRRQGPEPRNGRPPELIPPEVEGGPQSSVLNLEEMGDTKRIPLCCQEPISWSFRARASSSARRPRLCRRVERGPGCDSAEEPVDQGEMPVTQAMESSLGVLPGPVDYRPACPASMRSWR